jgi:hypothetical protein
MKGRQLTLEEVLNLEDGTKVWVEELNPRYSDWSGIHKRVLDELIAEKDEGIYEIRYLDGLGGDYGIEIYEWIEDELTIPDKIETPYYSYNAIKDMATEICNLRGLDLTDDNIRLIVEEFEEEK